MNKGCFLIIISICLFYSTNLYSQNNTAHCIGTNVIVAYSKVEDFQLACQSVTSIIEVARKIGLDENLNISLSFMDKLNTNNPYKSLAMFNPNNQAIQVLSIEACKKAFGNEVVLGQEIDTELHKSIIIHELAHALFWKNKGDKVIPREVYEYFSYAIQLALLEESYREKIITSSNVSAFSNESEITEDYYLLNPTQFAVKSYLHFMTEKNKDWSYLLSLLKKN